MKYFLPLFLLLPLTLFADGGLPNQPYIYVEGTAEIEKPADIIILRFDVVARNADQTKANEEFRGKAAKVFSMLKATKISEGDVVAQSLRSEPQFEKGESYSDSRGKVIGYTVTRPFKVTIHDIATFPKLVDELLAIGTLEFSGIDPALSKGKETEDQVWEKALADARNRAEKMLKPTGMKIDSVFAMSPVSFPEIAGTMLRRSESHMTQAVIVTGYNVPPQEGQSQYRVAPVTVNQSVHVIYLISPAK
jgi:uncharacterized protein